MKELIALVVALALATAVGIGVYGVIKSRPDENVAPAVVAKPVAPVTPPAADPLKPTPTPARDPVPEPPVEAAADCDEVSCVLNDYAGECCKKFRKGGGSPDSGDGDMLDRTMISDVMSKQRAKLASCGTAHAVTGKVRANVSVAPSGKVIHVDVSGDSAELGACVKGILQKTFFPATKRGGRFAYPFIF